MKKHHLTPLALAITCLAAPAADPVWTLYKGTTIVKPRVDYPTLAACNAAVPQKAGGTYTCRTSVAVPLPPIDHTMHGGLPVAPQSTWPGGGVQPTYFTRGGTNAAGQVQPDGRQTLLTSGNGIPPLAPPGDEGAWRLRCFWTKQLFDDPIVYPGRPGLAHHHTFFGNDAIDAFTTAENIRAAGNGSSCRGGALNLSGYWFPSMLDTETQVPLAPIEITLYYKSTILPYFGKQMVNGKAEYPRVTPWPVGLKMITGNPGQDSQPVAVEYVTGAPDWGCFNQQTGLYTSQTGGTMPSTCPSGSVVRARTYFPMCWDGVNLDSPDHKGHMADARRRSGTDVYYDPYKPLECPPTHPKVMTQITLSVSWALPTGVPLAKYRLASDVNLANPAGWTWHADAFEAHDPAIQAVWVRECVGGDRGYDAAGSAIPGTLRDCGSANLGDGRVTVEWDGN